MRPTCCGCDQAPVGIACLFPHTSHQAHFVRFWRKWVVLSSPGLRCIWPAHKVAHASTPADVRAPEMQSTKCTWTNFQTTVVGGKSLSEWVALRPSSNVVRAEATDYQAALTAAVELPPPHIIVDETNTKVLSAPDKPTVATERTRSSVSNVDCSLMQLLYSAPKLSHSPISSGCAPFAIVSRCCGCRGPTVPETGVITNGLVTRHRQEYRACV